jgi:hypothetical protein
MQNDLPESVFPITPPPALVHQWADMLSYRSTRSDQSVFTEVAQWGADQEREAMLAELKALHLPDGYAAKLRAARRPKPPSLKEQLIGIQPTPTSPSSLRTMQNNLPENEHPITPPPELVHQWADMLTSRSDQAVFTKVAQWGADQELKRWSCCFWQQRAKALAPRLQSLQPIGIQPTLKSPSSLRTMQNDLPENVFPISYAPTEESGNKKGEILWYANGHGWYISKWNLGYMSQTTHWTYMPEDLDIPLDEEVLKQEAFAVWRSGNVSFVHMNERERSMAWQAFNAGREIGRP